MRKGFLGLVGQNRPSWDVEGGGPGAVMEMILQGAQFPRQGKGRKRGDRGLRGWRLAAGAEGQGGELPGGGEPERSSWWAGRSHNPLGLKSSLRLGRNGE